METKIQNIIKVPVSTYDLQKLTKAINEAPNPLFKSPMDLLKKFTFNMYHILMNADNGKNVDMESHLIKSIYTMYHAEQIDTNGNHIYYPNNNWEETSDEMFTSGSAPMELLNAKDLQLKQMEQQLKLLIQSQKITGKALKEVQNKLQNQIDELDSSINAQKETSNLTPQFTKSRHFENSLRIKMNGHMFNRLMQLMQFNENQLIDVLALFIHLIALHHQTDSTKPKNNFIDDDTFHYIIGIEKMNPMFKNTIIETHNFYQFNSFDFYNGFTKPILDTEDASFATIINLKKPIQYTQNTIQNAYFKQILTIRKHINDATVENMQLNPTHQKPQTKNLCAFDYLNLVFTEIIVRAHIDSNERDFRDAGRKYEDPIPVTNFLMQQFKNMQVKHKFGFAQDLLFRYGEKLDKETQVKLLNHLNDNKVFQFEKTSSFSSYTYEINSLVELSPEKLKDYILETFNLKHVDGFRKFLSNNPQWVK